MFLYIFAPSLDKYLPSHATHPLHWNEQNGFLFIYLLNRNIYVLPPSPLKIIQLSIESFLLRCSCSYSGTLVNSIGFEWMLVGIAILCFIYAPLLTFLKAPPTREEKKVCGIDNAGMVSDANDVVVANNNTSMTEYCVTKL